MIHLGDPIDAVFIHIPRTSGNSITAAILRQPVRWIEDRGPNVLLGLPGPGLGWRHSRACELRPLLPQWDRCRKLTIVRDPWRVHESMWRYYQCHRARNIDCAAMASLSFTEFVRDIFPRIERGLYHHWCCDPETGEELGVIPYRYEELDQQWPRVCADLGLPHPIRRPRANSARGPAPAWTPEAIEIVLQRCPDDFARFGYSDSPSG